MSAVRWSDIRGKHVEVIGEQDVERGKLVTNVGDEQIKVG